MRGKRRAARPRRARRPVRDGDELDGGLGPLRAGVCAAIAEALDAYGTPALIGCRVALYVTGASLIFTVLARRARAPGGSAVARGKGRRERRDHAPRHDLTPPRHRPRPRGAGSAPARRARASSLGALKAHLDPARRDEPRQADPRSERGGRGRRDEPAAHPRPAGRMGIR